MKPLLRQIYDDLANGRLSQREALERIKALKLQEQSARTGALLATPIWQTSALAASVDANEFVERHVILGELPRIDAEALASLLPHSRCLYLQAGVKTGIAERYTNYAVTCFERIQAILQSRPRGQVLVQIVFAGRDEQMLFAGLSGLLKTAALENPRLIGQVIFVPAETMAAELAGLLRAERPRTWDTLIRYEQGVRQVLHLREVPAGVETSPVALKDDGVYLITGGLGRLGVLFAREILDQTRAARVVVTGRSSLSGEKQALFDGLAADGRVSYRPLDLGDLDRVSQLMAAIQSEHGKLDGILHCAGMVADSFILKKSAAELRRVLEPKVTGTFHLDEASRDLELDFFVLFSSVAGVMGNLGQADYATANGFMDHFAAFRNRQVAAGRRHGRTRSIDWPLWEAGGMTLDPATLEFVQRTTGGKPMQTAIGIEAFHRSLALPYDQILVAAGDVAQMRGSLLGEAPATPEPQVAQTAPVAAIAPESLAAQTQDYLRKQLSGLLKLPSHKIDPQAALESYGIDSILALKLTSELEKTFGSLSKTLFFEYQTIAELTQYFIQSHAARLASLFAAADMGDPRPKAAETPATSSPAIHTKRIASRRFSAAPAPATESDPIAIIGLSGRYPEAVDLDAYWRNLRDGRDCIVEVPKERWDWRAYYSEDRTTTGNHLSKWGGFIAGVDEFDPLFFNISPKEAKSIDPQERLFLQHAWMAIEDAGYTRASLQIPDAQDLPGQVGVYVGVMYTEYQLFGAESGARGKRMGLSGSMASISNRVSYVFNLHGPSMTLDTMCSSSLTAIHLACQDLKSGRTSLAIAGGVNVTIHPNKYLVLSAGQFISGDGACQSFGEGGDGYIPGEGVGVVVLKRLSEAERDGDHIYGVIRGTALNHGGKTNGYSVPNPQAQATAIGRALAESHTDARHVSYIEAHGTGTKLGDPIEIAALSKAFQQYTPDTGFCLIGSAKSNIGHCESAAGIAGLTKVLLQMQHRQLVPSLHSSQLNPLIDFDATPFVVNQSLRAWQPPVVGGRELPRIAGISSFGAGGSNAHVIVEEYQAPIQAPMAVGPVAIPLSARTAAQLQQKALDLLNLVRTREGTLDLAAVAYTLQLGREAMEERLGFVVSSVDELAAKLQSYVAGEQGIDDAYQGRVKRGDDALSLFSADADLQQTVDKWIANRKLPKLLDLWVKGFELDWNKLYGEARPRRISLPTYPFAKERHWIEMPAAGPVAASSVAATAVLHPLLHGNTSDLREQRYHAAFRGDEFFLAEHRVRAVDGSEQSTLPPSAYLEMARAAIEHASPDQPESSVLELRETVWSEPIAFTAGQEFDIALFENDDAEIEFEIYSRDAGQELVHCQGRAVWSAGTTPARIDLAQLERQLTQEIEPGDVYATSTRMGVLHGPSFQGIESVRMASHQLLAHLRLPKSVEEGAADYLLHPSLMEGALLACMALLDRAEHPCQREALSGMASLRMVAPSPNEMVAWARYAVDGDGTLDLDLCDARGNVCVQMRGLSWQPVSFGNAEQAVVHAPSPAVPAGRERIAIAAPLRKEIVMSAEQQAAPAPVERRKPAAIALAGLGVPASAPEAPSAGRTPITLSNTTVAGAAPAVSPVRLFDEGNGIFTIQVGATATKDVAAHLRQALEKVREEPSVKVLQISGAEQCLDHDEAVAQGLYQAVASFPYPVIAVLPKDTIGAGFLFAALCDFMVCSEDARYGYPVPTSPVADVLRERFGDARAEELLYGSTASTGRQLRAKGWTCPFLPEAEVGAHAKELASALAAKSREALHLLKQHLTRQLAGLVAAWTPVEIEPVASESLAKFVAPPAKHISCDTPVENVVVLRLGLADPRDLVVELGQTLSNVRRADCKALVLASDDPDFLSNVADDVAAELQRLVLESSVPLVAALEGNARGNAWLLAQSCDACIYSETGIYSARQVAHAAAALFTHRLGGDAGREILLTGADYRGSDLRQSVGTSIVAEREHVLSAALRVAEGWARLPRPVLASWKQQSAKIILTKIGGLHERTAEGGRHHTEASAAGGHSAAIAMPIAVQSHVISATAHPGGIVVVKMEDREAKNMFSDALIHGLTEVFAHVEQTPAYKVVVLTGYDNYFASGGTKENLLSIQAGKARFTDTRIYQQALDCRLPVIAAMQGHGIGAGWSLGMFADLVLLSEESRYVSPYMNYGFTPGAGATWILADRIGQDLARESLLTAQLSTGRALKDRGLLSPVLPRQEVLPAAMALAQQIAEQPRRRLIELKRQLTAHVHEPLEETYQLELAMHEKTFVGQSETLAQIQDRFHQEFETSAPRPPQPRIEAASPQIEAASPAADGDSGFAVTATLRTLLANELLMQESDIDDHAQFVDLGLDSISGVSWIRRINEKYQTSIEATKVYSYSTLSQLSRFVNAEAERQGTLSSEAAPPAAAATVTSAEIAPPQHKPVVARAMERRTTRRKRTTSRVVASAPAAAPAQAIAVIGMAGQFPQARNVEEFWRNLAEGKNCITQIPPSRWDANAYYQPGAVVAGKSYSLWLGALDEYDLFDPRFFNISPTEAESMDPQQRLFLQACWHSIENAGYDARVLAGSRCGVFVGCATGDYHHRSRQHLLSAHGFTGSATSILAARISYFLDLQGPCVSIDTACSSSLVAIAQACDSLSSGISDVALAGGVYVMGGPEMHIMTSQAGMLSPEGRCFTFDHRADGFVSGEGVGVVMLKRLADAERDGDNICGVIQGWGINQDGRTNGITAPNPESQTRLEQEVYDRYGIDPAQIQLIEAHGTATRLGDPIEVEGLKASFRKYTQNTGYCALGSVKSNIGHCLTAAGIAGVIKLLLALKHKQLPPTINFERLNEHIDLAGSPFYVNTELQPWELRGAPRRQAAVSSFGFSGTNAHLVIGEGPAPAEVRLPVAVLPQNAKTIIPLSARTTEQLGQRARDLLDFLRKEGPSVDLDEIAYTLQVGRAPMEERLGFIVSSVEQLAARLEAYIEGQSRIDDVHQGQVKRNREALSLFTTDADLQETVDKWIANRKLSKLADLWVKGLELDWGKLYGEVKPRRISLPTYPFAKERYWIETPSTQTATAGASLPGAAVLHRRRIGRRATHLRLQQSAAGSIAAPVHDASHEASRPLFFRECWTEQPAVPVARQANPKFVLFTDPDSHAALAAGDAAGRFADACVVYRADRYEQVSEREFHCRMNDEGDLRRLLGDVTTAAQPMTIVYGWARGEHLAGIHALFDLFKAVRTAPHPVRQVILVGHYDPSRVDTCWDYSWVGFARSLKHVLPKTEIPVLYTESGAASAEQLLDASQSGGVLLYRGGRRLALSVDSVDPARTSASALLKQGGTYLITGGLGALGLHFARDLAEHYGAKLHLLGRREPSPDIQKQLDRLIEAGARDAQYHAVDVGDRSALAAWAESLPDAVSGIIHAAGVESSGMFFERTPDEIDAVLSPKTLGTLALDEAFAGQPLDFICCFSSTAASLGDHGAADYAVANRFQTAYGIHRQQMAGRGKTLVINWPLWLEGGMGFKDREQAARYLELAAREFGNQPLPTQTGLAIWRDLLEGNQPQTMVMVGQPSRVDKFLRRIYEGRRPAIEPQARAEREAGYHYANKVEEVYSLILPAVSSRMEYLTFCPFESRRPGFSMSATYLNPKKHAADRHLVHVKQTEMRQVLFCNEDFTTLRSVLDFGCGHGTDVIQMGSLFPHLHADGFTITADQARLGNQRIAARNLDSRVKIHHKDSAADAFPGRYDLIFGIEVCPHIEDKDSLFRNVRGSLNDDGTVLLMDVISNEQAALVDRTIGMSIPTQEEWLGVLSRFQFRVDQFVDVSPQIANFLYDPDVDENAGNLPQAIRDTYSSYAQLSSALEKGMVSYVLVRLKVDDDRSDDELAAHNRERLRNPTPYPAALEAMQSRPRVDYPAAVEAFVDDAEAASVPAAPKRVASRADAARNGRSGDLEHELRASLAEVLKLTASDVDVDQPFSELGLDSFLGVEWINGINQKYGTALPNMVAYDYPSVRALAAFLEGELPQLPASAPAPDSGETRLPSRPATPDRVQVSRMRTRRTRSNAKRTEPTTEKIAIIGMSGRYPQAPSLREYWKNLAEGKNAIVEIPAHRWDVGRYYDPALDAKDRTCSKWLGALDDVDCFDPLFFRIAPHDAVHMDPQHRLFLEESYKAFEDAGYCGDTLNNRKCGVYLGISTSEYALRLRQTGVVSAPVTSSSFAIAAARIAYYLNLKGPAISVDTACSSSLVALHLACQALQNGETDMALAGGVNLWLTPESYLSMSQAGMLSPSGQCKAFDDAADGIVVGEGVGALVLKRLKDAQDDNDFIYGVILGSGINQDGRTNGITAPSANSQIALIRDVYARYGIDPETISYVEAHGTGTKLGDPIELSALTTVFKEKTARKNYCALASVKSNIGHTAAAAGVASVHKVLLSMQHRTLVPSLNVTKENAHFDLGDSPFYISRETRGWDVAAGSPRRAAVSSFGFSGTNAHVVIEEYPRPAIPATGDSDFIVPLSAVTEEQLRQKARDLLEHVASSQPVDLASIAYTLQVGRDAMEERLGFVVSSVDQLREKLSAYIDGEKNIEHVHRGRAEARGENMTFISRDDDMQEAIDRWIARRKLPKLLDLWTKGLSFDWNKLYGDAKPRRMSLPTYPFAREHYWIDETPASTSPESALEFDGNMKYIEDIINQIGDDLMDTDEAVRLLKVLV